jgi:hypothetical protein
MFFITLEGMKLTTRDDTFDRVDIVRANRVATMFQSVALLFIAINRTYV